MENKEIQFHWVGSEEHFVDQIAVHNFQHIKLGRFGGNSSAGQTKNEDGCFILGNVQEDWELVVLLDAHHTAQSAQLIVETFKQQAHQFRKLLCIPIHPTLFQILEREVLALFQSEAFLSQCREITGETACLIVVRKAQYVWWFSVGDCLLYVFHEEFAKLGQYQLNQRQFYEWIGQVNTFAQPVPCYTVSTRELRQGNNYIFLTTDGLIECPNEPYQHAKDLYDVIKTDAACAVQQILHTIQQHDVKDSTTIISWHVHINERGAMPSDL